MSYGIKVAFQSYLKADKASLKASEFAAECGDTQALLGHLVIHEKLCEELGALRVERGIALADGQTLQVQALDKLEVLAVASAANKLVLHYNKVAKLAREQLNGVGTSEPQLCLNRRVDSVDRDTRASRAH